MASVVRIKHRKGESEEAYELRKAQAIAAKAVASAEPPEDEAPRAPKKPRTPRSSSQKEAIAALVAIPNTLMLMFPATHDDALNEGEAEQLVDALDHYQQKDERARRGLHRLLKASSFAELISVGLMLAIPRLIRHGLLPRTVGQHMANLAAEQAGTEYPPYEPAEPAPEMTAPAPTVNGWEPVGEPV